MVLAFNFRPGKGLDMDVPPKYLYWALRGIPQPSDWKLLLRGFVLGS